MKKTHYRSPSRPAVTLCGYWIERILDKSIPSLLHTAKVEEVDCVKCLKILRADIDQTITKQSRA